MEFYSTIIAMILGMLIIFYETLRSKNSKPVDIITGVNLIYFLSFVIPPISIYLLDVQLSAWVYKVNLEGKSPVIASLYSLIGYIVLIIGYSVSNKLKPIKNIDIEFVSNNKKTEKFAHIIGLTGLIFLIIFIYSVGGINNFFVLNTQLRSGSVEDLPYAFIRNLALFIPISAQIFYSLYKFTNRTIFSRYYLFFVLYLIFSIILYFNRATRMGLFLFVISFLLINALYYKSSLKKYVPILSVLLLLFVFYGKRFYNLFVLDEFSFNEIDINFNVFVNQFSFPYYTLTNAVENSFFDDIPRLFIDFVLGILNLFPSAIIPFDIPKTLTELNTEYFSNGVPIDIISIGFYSFGISGIIIVTFLLGLQIGFLEKLLEDKSNILVVVFYSQFLFFITLLIPYAGPANTLKSNFCLFIAFSLFIYMFSKQQDSRLVIQKGKQQLVRSKND